MYPPLFGGLFGLMWCLFGCGYCLFFLLCVPYGIVLGVYFWVYRCLVDRPSLCRMSFLWLVL